MSFLELTNEVLSTALLQGGFETPTEIQTRAIPIVASGKDLIAQSATGTGKTLAYLLPIYMKIDKDLKSTQAIVLTPTHELAAQVFKHSKILSDATGIQSELIIGGVNIKRQIENLKDKPRVIIGSAGRVLELIKLKKIQAHTVKIIVVDEADRLLDAKNYDGLTQVIKTTLKDRQLLFFSASIGTDTMVKAKALAKDPDTLNASGKLNLPENIEHMYFVCEEREKIEVLRKIIHGAEIKRAIAFLNNQDQIDNMTKRLNFHGIPSASLYGAAYRDERKKALDDFASGKVTLLVASDLAARGIDIKDITHIINLDVPEDPVFYLHRAGRTGRMNKHGVAITIATTFEVKNIFGCEKRLKFKAIRKEMRFGKITDYKEL